MSNDKQTPLEKAAGLPHLTAEEKAKLSPSDQKRLEAAEERFKSIPKRGEKFDTLVDDFRKTLKDASCADLAKLDHDLGPINPNDLLDTVSAAKVAVAGTRDRKGCHK